MINVLCIVFCRIYENMVHLVKNNLIVSELEQAKKSIINENTFDVK